MARIVKPRLRYFARFKEDFGYLRAVIRNGKTRKWILTRIAIKREQLGRLDTSGSMIIKCDSDIRVNTRLHEFTDIVWRVVTPIIERGDFDSTPGWAMTRDIFQELSRVESERKRKYEEWREGQEAKARAEGDEIITFREFKDIVSELKSRLPQDEYEALWKKGGAQ